MRDVLGVAPASANLVCRLDDDDEAVDLLHAAEERWVGPSSK